jgi:hypothetical protein
LIIQWIFQWRSWTSMASSNSTTKRSQVGAVHVERVEVGEVALDLGAAAARATTP